MTLSLEAQAEGSTTFKRAHDEPAVKGRYWAVDAAPAPRAILPPTPVGEQLKSVVSLSAGVNTAFHLTKAASIKVSSTEPASTKAAETNAASVTITATEDLPAQTTRANGTLVEATSVEATAVTETSAGATFPE